MEPLSIISLAGNVVQFVEFTAKLLGEAQEIFESTDGLSKATREIRTISESMISCADQMRSLEASERASDLGLIKICTASTDVAKQVLSALPAVEEKEVRKGKIKSMRQLLSAMWKKDEVRRLAKRMSELRAQLNTVVVLSISGRLQAHLQHATQPVVHQPFQNKPSTESCFEATALRKLLINIEPLGQDTSSEVAQTKAMTLLNKVILAIENQRHPAEARPTSQMDEENEHATPVKMTTLLNNITLLAEEYQCRIAILERLWFDRIDVRIERVPVAHAATFRWVLHSTNESEADVVSSSIQGTELRRWLSNDSDTFWVTGKPGSGKSTLMKHIWHQERTMQRLSSWAAGEPLYAAKFFFWNGGTRIQKSLEGCLRTLLFELLEKSPVPMSQVFKRRWEQYKQGLPNSATWEVRELCSAIKNMIGSAKLGPRYCLFIDGLDEFEDDPELIINVVKELETCPRTKLCVSSRPWPIFDDHFGRDPKRKICLQDLTRNDIYHYSQDLFYHRMEMAQWPNRLQASINLAHQVTNRAEGVFLWVYLAVASLCKGITNGDSPNILNARLQEFPSELDSFYRHILCGVEPVYRKQSAKVLQVTLSTCEPLYLMAYSFMFEDDPQFAIDHPHSIMSVAETEARLEMACRQLYARCYGLLEPVNNSTSGEEIYYAYQVDFLHRTARDFVLHNDIREISSVYLDPDFHPNFPLCRALLAQIKTEPNTDSPLILKTVRKIVTWSTELFKNIGVLDLQLLDSTCEVVKDEYGLRSRYPNSETTFYTMAIDLGLSRYIEQKLDADPGLIPIHGELILLWCLERFTEDPNEQLVMKLLNGGAVQKDKGVEDRARMLLGLQKSDLATKRLQKLKLGMYYSGDKFGKLKAMSGWTQIQVCRFHSNRRAMS